MRQILYIFIFLSIGILFLYATNNKYLFSFIEYYTQEQTAVHTKKIIGAEKTQKPETTNTENIEEEQEATIEENTKESPEENSEIKKEEMTKELKTPSFLKDIKVITPES